MEVAQGQQVLKLGLGPQRLIEAAAARAVAILGCRVLGGALFEDAPSRE